MNLSFVLFSAIVATASANCNPNKQPNNGQCEEYGGQCSKAVDIFFNQIGNVNSKAPQNVLSYGRFCGAATKCPALNNGLEDEEEDIQDPDVEACPDSDTPLDEVCKKHDKCLDNSGNNPGSDSNIDPLESCPCHLLFLNELFNAPAPDKDLCDEDFYNKPVLSGAPYASFLSILGQGAVSPEVILLTAPFCFLFVDGGECLEAGFDQLLGFCVPLIGALTTGL